MQKTIEEIGGIYKFIQKELRRSKRQKGNNLPQGLIWNIQIVILIGGVVTRLFLNMNVVNTTTYNNRIDIRVFFRSTFV